MKVLVISHACVSRSNQRKLSLLAVRSDVELYLVTPQWWIEGTRRIECRAAADGFEVIPLPAAFAGKQFIHFYPGLRRYLKNIDPDIIHVEEEPNSAACFQALRLKSSLGLKARTVIFSWQNMHQTWRLPNPRALFYPRFEKYSLGNADCLIAGNVEGRAVFSGKGFQRRIIVLPQFGVDAGRFRKTESGELRKKLGLEGLVVGYAGRLLKMKGLHALLWAASKLTCDFQLLIVGDGPEKPQVESEAERLGIDKRLVFAGSVGHDEIPAYLNCMDVLVLPSERTANWKEQFGRVLVEAMSCEVAVMGSSCGEIPNVISDAGLVFEEGDREDLRIKLEGLMADNALRAELAAKGKQRVRNEFADEIIAEKTYQVYRDVVLANRDSVL